MLILAGLLWQSWGMARMKAAQRLNVSPMAPVALQGQEDGHVSAPQAMAYGPDGSLFILSRFEKGFFIQRFNSAFQFEKSRWFLKDRDKDLSDPVALAAQDDGGLIVAERGGRALRLGPDFKTLGEFKLPAGEVAGLDRGDDGTLYLLDPVARKVLALSPEGGIKAESQAKKLSSPKHLALSGSGRLAVLDETRKGLSIKVFTPALALERVIPVDNVIPSPPNRVAAGAGDTVAVNDAYGSRGILFYRVSDGRFMGETLGLGEEPMIHSGFVGGDRRTGDYYLHFVTGLMKCRLPLE